MKESRPLNRGWRLRHSPWQEGLQARLAVARPAEGWLDASVPGDVHLDCMRDGIIPDPFVGTNMDRCIWMEDKDWWYRLDFEAPPPRRDQNVFLLFEGLDTFATVFLNGEAVATHANMFTPLRVDVTETLRPGTNRLAVRLASPRFSARIDTSPRVTGLAPRERLTTRKAQACYGWDIAPRLVTCGIWRPVSLLLVDAVEIENTMVRTLRATRDSAEVEVSVDVRTHASSPVRGELELRLGTLAQTLPFACESPRATVTHTFNVRSPELWWPHNHGTPCLHETAVDLKVDGKRLDQQRRRCGIRTVELEQKPQPDGTTSFRFLVNGKPVFLKGINWTPPDALYARLTDERRSRLLEAAVAANVNAVRVWGGGVYESDAFYDRCDELGILVWQDFMFACGCYPQDEPFLEQVASEAEHVVRRLRSHPCILTWCGDNENDWLAGREYGVPDYPANPLSKKVLPEVTGRLSPDIPYVPSSPFSPHLEDQNADAEGDVHLWAHGRSYASDFYLARRPRMVTEIGHIAMPDLETVRSFVPEQELWPVWSDTWRLHSADPRRILGNARLQSMFESIRERGWEPPHTLEDLIRKTQQLQCEATAAWIRHFAALPHCWGLFLWNLADCWPQVSDAYIAWPFRPKPALDVVRAGFAAIRR
jgi:beta-mannosidase